ncbi:hypothetical protein F-S17_0434 [Faustovirus]|nr:endoglucanase-like domain protein [Faustovirus]QJX72205.1 hypothetical protein F-M6_0442 [Faustovirus]QJX72700.1 hypothetical protein F-S17_0434 [Faustovirus]QJX73196.1 hypothetical protein F-VV57_0435 [Faustovirus]QJX73703.1 hypothetical protein F-VV63_0437 [Faustovirus]
MVSTKFLIFAFILIVAIIFIAPDFTTGVLATTLILNFLILGECFEKFSVGDNDYFKKSQESAKAYDDITGAAGVGAMSTSGRPQMVPGYDPGYYLNEKKDNEMIMPEDIPRGGYSLYTSNGAGNCPSINGTHVTPVVPNVEDLDSDHYYGDRSDPWDYSVSERQFDRSIYEPSYDKYTADKVSYTAAYTNAQPIIVDAAGDATMDADQRMNLMARQRFREKRAQDGWAVRNADYYKYHFSDELAENEAREWWGEYDH